MIWKCQLCKVCIKAIKVELFVHIGQLENLPCYCFMDGCDKYPKSCPTLMNHLKNSHNLMVPDMNSHQYYRLQEIWETYVQ
ncbi:hypothetical protein L596_000197 [Steinernema carpocapsae]|uniref:C2H2-type domain-containing protein n=1 Tax=Steinernema carpocapsae TaxID=34508 RepID=A0A4U8UJV3_STECR|nr:hypothetical protein L596_000197 [Steinernema carpocapsae]